VVDRRQRSAIEFRGRESLSRTNHCRWCTRRIAPSDFTDWLRTLAEPAYDDLLTVDSKSNWHFIVNHAGKFEAAPFALSQETSAVSKTGAGQLPFFAFVTTARLLSSGKLNLVALTMDGRVEIFEEQPGRAMSARPRFHWEIDGGPNATI